jgi:hypothetical protein
MADYKLYGLDGAGQIAGAPEYLHASSDEEALAAVRELGRRNLSELWQGSRLVARVEPTR